MHLLRLANTVVEDVYSHYELKAHVQFVSLVGKVMLFFRDLLELVEYVHIRSHGDCLAQKLQEDSLLANIKIESKEHQGPHCQHHFESLVQSFFLCLEGFPL